MRGDLPTKVYDGDAGLAGDGPNPGASPATPLRFASGALSGTRAPLKTSGTFGSAARGRWAAVPVAPIGNASCRCEYK